MVKIDKSVADTVDRHPEAPLICGSFHETANEEKEFGSVVNNLTFPGSLKGEEANGLLPLRPNSFRPKPLASALLGSIGKISACYVSETYRVC